MNKTRHYIRTLLLMLLLLAGGGMANEAWAKKVTYHILTKPFTVKTYNGDGTFHNNIRVEALQCTSEEETVGLPDQFKSPLVLDGSFKYWGSATSTYESLYDNGHGTKIINTKYYIYDCSGGEFDCLSDKINEGESVGDYTDIYVTYDYNPANGILDLNGGTKYNVALVNSDTQKFMCFNRSRNNRVANALSSGLSGEELANDDFVVPENGSAQLGWKWSQWGPIGVFMGFKFTGQDPYNITITTSYEGKELQITDKVSNVDNTGTVKPYAGSTLMSKVGANSLWFDASNNVHYKIESGISSSGQWTQAIYDDCYSKYYAPEAKQYDTWNGFYRSESPTMNAFALLNNPKGDYMFVGSKMNQGDGNSTKPDTKQPNNGNYYSYFDNYDTESGNRRSQPYFKLQAIDSSLPISFYEIKTYTLKLKTHGSNTVLTTTMKWSDARASERIVNHVPDLLKRKYVKFTGAYAEKEVDGVKQADTSKPISTFADAYANGNVIWLDYETDTEALPFEFLPNGGDYKDAQWYTMRMDGVANPKYIAYEGASNALVVTDGSGNAKGSNTASEVHQGENSAEAMVAFMGDPYELKILNRKACETAPAGNKFIGSTAATEGTVLTTDNDGDSGITTWEIVYESIGEEGMLLRQFNTVADPKYIGLGSAANDKPVTYSETASRIRVVKLEKLKYTYHIVRDNDGNIAVKASDSHDVGKELQSWSDIPEIIRSPFLKDGSVTFYGSLADAKNKTNAIHNAPYDSNRDIYVRYSVSVSGSTYNIRLNNDYIYTTDEGDVIKSKAMLDEGNSENGAYQWLLDYSDPYHMSIKNIGKSKYVNVSFSNEASITWSDSPSYFVAKSGAIAGTYEVMAATGDEIDASATYYNIGRPSANTVKLYNNTSYQHGNAVLRFQLIGTTATRVVYHLIDMAGKDLLQATTRQVSTDAPDFPPEYHSPLVDNYYYYTESQFDIVGEGSNKVYTLKSSQTPLNQVGSNSNIYVLYDVNDLVDLKAGQLYLLKYEAGEEFYQENGSDGRTTTKKKAIYPYCNGDGNFFVYDQDQYNLQQEGASSTRTRWAWYVESNVEGAPLGDPYHVMIKSRQTESYPKNNSSEYNAYFMTYKPNDYDKVITALGWPGMNSETATEYMVLGSEGQYQLVTTYEIGGSRYVVDSFEQYWKTWDTIRKKVYGESSAKENDSDPIIIPDDTKYPYENPTEETLRHYLENTLNWHSYEKWAYAKRWNGYNNGYSSNEGTHEKSKGWEKIEHWFQTVSMGEGYFDFVKTDINPVLILLDQHGWEIMRKPIPTDPEDPLKDAKYAAIRPYNSPMVKEYAFWATAKKRSGFHQYYLLSDRIGGDTYTSTDLTNLPPYDSKNVHDKKGNLNDQYVTYIVKDEYASSYTYNTTTKKWEASEFLIEQGSKYAAVNDATPPALSPKVLPSGGLKQYITEGNATDVKEKWYVKPNADIDIEMGYNDTGHSWTKKKADGSWDNKNPNAYEHYKYKYALTAQYIADKDSLGYFSFSNGFDPYNIQIESVSVSGDDKFMKTNATGATLHEGSIIGSYPADPGPKIAMGDNTTTISPAPKWYDSRNLAVTNATYMAVQDEKGNMQLMPRFDHATRMSEFGELIAPVGENVTKTYTKLYRPEVYVYLIIDNDGHESLRYKSGGDLTPQTPDHFKSPLATNFKYYATATYNSETGTYSDIENDENEIKESFDGTTDNMVYVRYEYDEEADSWNMLKGNWLTMKLNEKDAIYDSGIKQASGGKPSPVDEDDKQWQWKFAHNSQPDPYAIYIYNRSQSAGTKARTDRFALLYHSAGDYALAKAGEGTYTYSFLNGDGMNTTTAASVAMESGFKPTSGTFDGKKSQVKLTDDVTHTFTYKVYTNGGVEAISATQSQDDVFNNDWKPVLPSEARSPLLNTDQYRYYERSLAGTVAENDTLNKTLSLLYGLYEDIIYTHYTAYNANVSSYVVPNVRNATNVDPVARGVGSNDAPIGLDGKRPYNIIWYNDKMMKRNETSITYEADKDLQFTAPYEWELEGDDPYAIKIKSVGETNKYIHEATGGTTTELSATATPFMLLNKDGYDYGVFAKTGAATTMLSGYGNELTTSDPTKFIPFALSTLKVVYHLVIANINSSVSIPYAELVNGNRVEKPDKEIPGTTLRNLESTDPSGGEHVPGDRYQLGSTLNSTTYCYNAGPVSLGDALERPQVFYRPNVNYDYYIGGVYKNEWTEDDEMNSEYKGLKMTHMVEDDRLLNKIVWINVVYTFMGGLDTNSGTGFVTSVNDNKWYTFETSDATPRLAECTNTTSSDGLKTKSGYATHYTNDYLWTPVGDPYGFKMYNRYIHKNRKENKVMSTEDFTTDRAIVMVDDIKKWDPTDPNESEKPYLPEKSVYELLANSSTTSGYFRVHPVVNMKDVTQYYIKNNSSTGAMTLNTTPTEWRFGLSEDLMSPYYQGAGYIGGLNDAGKKKYEEALKIEGELAKLMALQNVVYNHDNNNAEDDPTNPNYIVHYTPGYYRLHSQPGSSGITTPRYASGYTHKIELTAGAESTAIPLHFYEVEEYDVNDPTFKDLGTTLDNNYTETPATRGDIPLVTVDKDPASIFYFPDDEIDHDDDPDTDMVPGSKIITQGLYVKENKMTDTEGNATSFQIIDIGAGIVALQGGSNFLKYAQTSPIYDLKFDNTASTVESARWCMKPVQISATAGNGEMPLKATTNNGGDENYYTTFYAPFDVLLTDEKDEAFILPTDGWPAITPSETNAVIHPKKIGQYNTEANGCPDKYQGSNQFIPAGTPVIIRTKNTGGEVTMVLPTAEPSSSIATALSGQYLEQMLTHISSDLVFAFGRAYTHSNEFTYNKGTGVVTPAGLETDKGVGFYKNANTNRELSPTKSGWLRNNKYVYANKAYYYYEEFFPPARQNDLYDEESPTFVPVIFDFEEEEGKELEPDGSKVEIEGDGCMYDLLGRKVATREQVEDGSWRYRVASGVYIVNGKKIRR